MNINKIEHYLFRKIRCSKTPVYHFYLPIVLKPEIDIPDKQKFVFNEDLYPKEGYLLNLLYNNLANDFENKTFRTLELLLDRAMTEGRGSEFLNDLKLILTKYKHDKEHFWITLIDFFSRFFVLKTEDMHSLMLAKIDLWIEEKLKEIAQKPSVRLCPAKSGSDSEIVAFVIMLIEAGILLEEDRDGNAITRKNIIHSLGKLLGMSLSQDSLAQTITRVNQSRKKNKNILIESNYPNLLDFYFHKFNNYYTLYKNIK